MEQETKLLVYRASAGSGKTFTLAVEYIRLLIEDPFAYRRILAVTFTNKATAEMKERILSQLYGIAHEDPESDDYLSKIEESSTKSREEIRKAAGIALHHIIHDYSRFRIETIDSFFQSVMRNLARELELNANLNIELNNEEVLNDAVDSMIEKLDRRSPVLYWLLEYIENRISDNNRWNVSGEIKSFGKNIFNEEYIEKGQDLREKLKQTHFIVEFRSRLKELKTECDDIMNGYYEHFQEILSSRGLNAGNLARKENGICSYFKKLHNGNYKDEIRNATVEKSLQSEEAWVTKTAVRREEILELARNELIPLLQAAEEMRSRANEKVNSCQLASKHLYNLPLLVHIDNEVRLLNEAHNRFLLSDTNALLHQLISEGDASFIYEKIGTNIDIVMIDEFQDTSRLQWSNFHLLLEECLAQSNGSLVVGDIKQSIYRWRNGDWRILANLGKDAQLRTEGHTLDTNWRSQANIIDFNNAFFTETCRKISQGNEQQEAFPELRTIYNDVVQETQKSRHEGYVRITLIPEERNGKEQYQERMLQELTSQVDRLVHDGVPETDIAILIRKKKFIPLIADYFDKHTDYRIVSDEAFCMEASTPLCMLMDALRFLTVPDDRIACARLAVAYQKDVLHRDIHLNTVLLNRTEDFLPEDFTGNLNTWRLMPLYELLERLYDLFEMKEIPHQEAYVCAFYDAVAEYLKNKSSELTAFISYWDETLHSKTIPSGEPTGIRIMSIHKSKGLEFHTVLLPFCDWRSENETNNQLVWCQVDPQQTVAPVFNELDLIPVNYSSAMKESVFKSNYLQEQQHLWVDNLNLLYVAFTRARQNLIVWGKSGAGGSVSQWLESTLNTLAGKPLPCLRKNTGNQEWHEQEKELRCTAVPLEDTDSSPCPHPGTEENETEKSPEILIYEYGYMQTEQPESKPLTPCRSANRLTAPRQPVKVVLKDLEEKTGIEFRQSNRSAAFIDQDEDEPSYADRGNLLHYLFACIRHADELEQAIEQLRFEGLFRTEEEVEQVRRIAGKILDIPQVNEWFGPGWTPYNECTIIAPNEDGTVHSERPDRVMQQGDKMVVIDFKFARKKQAHVEQVQRYMRLLQDMGYHQVSGYLLYGYSQELQEITLS